MPDVWILYSPKHDKIRIKSNPSLHTAHPACSGLPSPCLSGFWNASLWEGSTWAASALSAAAECLLKALTPLWKHTACLGARQAKAASSHAHPPAPARASFLPSHLRSPLKSCLLILACFSKWLHFQLPSAQTTCRATSSPSGAALSGLDKYKVRDGHSNRHTLPVFPLHSEARTWIGQSKGAIQDLARSRCQECDL